MVFTKIAPDVLARIDVLDQQITTLERIGTGNRTERHERQKIIRKLRRQLTILCMGVVYYGKTGVPNEEEVDVTFKHKGGYRAVRSPDGTIIGFDFAAAKK